jgi:hypothetical protein
MLSGEPSPQDVLEEHRRDMREWRARMSVKSPIQDVKKEKKKPAYKEVGEMLG